MIIPPVILSDPWGQRIFPPGQVLMRSGVSLLGAPRWRPQLHKSDLEGLHTE